MDRVHVGRLPRRIAGNAETTDEELAEFFQNTTFCDSCFINKNECGTESYSCIQRWLDWLKQEAEGGTQ